MHAHQGSRRSRSRRNSPLSHPDLHASEKRSLSDENYTSTSLAGSRSGSRAVTTHQDSTPPRKAVRGRGGGSRTSNSGGNRDKSNIRDRMGKSSVSSSVDRRDSGKGKRNWRATASPALTEQSTAGSNPLNRERRIAATAVPSVRTRSQTIGSKSDARSEARSQGTASVPAR